MRGSSSSSKRQINVIVGWVKRQPPKVKAFLCVVGGMAALVFLRFIVHDHDNLFVAAEACHAIGIAVLIYKLTKEKTCAGQFFSRRHSLNFVARFLRSAIFSFIFWVACLILSMIATSAS